MIVRKFPLSRVIISLNGGTKWRDEMKWTVCYVIGAGNALYLLHLFVALLCPGIPGWWTLIQSSLVMKSNDKFLRYDKTLNNMKI